MSFPPPRNGYYYSRRELLLQREVLHNRKRRTTMLCLPLLAVFGGWPGLGIAFLLLIVQGLYLVTSDHAYFTKGEYWDDLGWMLKLQRRWFWITFVACLICPPFLTALTLFIWKFVLETIEPWLRKPSERELVDAAVQAQRPQRIRE